MTLRSVLHVAAFFLDTLCVRIEWNSQEEAEEEKRVLSSSRSSLGLNVWKIWFTAYIWIGLAKHYLLIVISFIDTFIHRFNSFIHSIIHDTVIEALFIRCSFSRLRTELSKICASHCHYYHLREPSNTFDQLNIYLAITSLINWNCLVMHFVAAAAASRECAATFGNSHSIGPQV